jgi:hypothetical protein
LNNENFRLGSRNSGNEKAQHIRDMWAFFIFAVTRRSGEKAIIRDALQSRLGRSNEMPGAATGHGSFASTSDRKHLPKRSAETGTC